MLEWSSSDPRDFRDRGIQRETRAHGLGAGRPTLQVSNLDRHGKKKAQPWADLICTYGIEVLSGPGAPRRDYEFLIGLAFNVERVELRKSWRVLRAVTAALSGKLGYEWYDAINDDPVRAGVQFDEATEIARRAEEESQEKSRTPGAYSKEVPI